MCGINRTTLIGLSMGGTGALILARDIDSDLVIALSPQALIDPVLGQWDHRFLDLRRRISRFRVPDTSCVLRANGDYRLIFSFDDPVDMRHAAVFARHLNRGRLSVVRGGHNVGHEMARRQVLDDFIFDLIEGHADDLQRYGIFASSDYVFDIAEREDVENAAKILELGMSRPDLLPAFCYRRYQDEIFNLFLKRGRSYTDVMALLPFPMHASQVVTANELLLYAVHGWAADDLWSVGRHHLIRMRIMDLSAFPMARLSLAVEPFVNARYRSQRLFITMNGRRVANDLMEYREGLDNKILIPIEALSPIVELHIETPDCISPQQLGLSSDGRWLGIRLLGIETFPF
jgi:hypothetical protein